jgi:hypothetical protein
MHLRRRSRVKAGLQARLSEYERRYGVPSERLADAFRDVFHRDGEVRETEDFLAWSSLYAAFQALASKRRRRLRTLFAPAGRRRQ